MAGVKLFGTKDRDASHKKLEEILRDGTHPMASCREDPNDPVEPYTVWSEGPDPFVLAPAPAAQTSSEEEALDKLADKLAELAMKKLMKKLEVE